MIVNADSVGTNGMLNMDLLPRRFTRGINIKCPLNKVKVIA